MHNIDYNQLVKKIQKYDHGVSKERIIKACEIAAEAHKDQKRASGELYFVHPYRVAEILVDMKMDEDSVITALLHDTVEDTSVSIEYIEQEFGSEVAKLVDGVTKLAKIKFKPDHIRQAENFRKLLLAMSEDIRVLLVKLADRLHNMQTIQYVKIEKKIRIAHETMEIYAPLAERIGMQKLKNELQDLSFEVLHNEERQSIISRLDFLRKDGGFFVDKIESHIKNTLSDSDIEAKVVGREKTPCSIWQKMSKKNISFEQLSDIMAFRVVVNGILDCYQVIGVIHAAYHMVPGSFKDYISTPKDNGYRALHTVVVGPTKHQIEIQVRTNEMDAINELGVAAHWLYKQDQKFTKEGRQFRWVRQLLNILESSNLEDFIENTKLEMYEDQVFCFTPKGEIIALPRGSTLVDFAFALHSEVGFSCVGAKVNGRIAPLKTSLENGDQIEIIRANSKGPSREWLNYVKTGKAKSAIDSYIRNKQKTEYIKLGKSIIIKYMLSQKLYDDVEDLESSLKKILGVFHKVNLEDLYTAIGEGTISRIEVMQVLNLEKRKKKKNLSLKNGFEFFNFKKKKLDKSVLIKSAYQGAVICSAECCHPLPGDKIMGVMVKGKGIEVHFQNCEAYLASNKKENIVEVSWEKNSYEQFHLGRIKISLKNQYGSLANLTNALADKKVNINNIRVLNRSSDFYDLIVDIDVRSVDELKNIIGSVRSLKQVHSAKRKY